MKLCAVHCRLTRCSAVLLSCGDHYTSLLNLVPDYTILGNELPIYDLIWYKRRFIFRRIFVHQV